MSNNKKLDYNHIILVLIHFLSTVLKRIKTFMIVNEIY